MSKKILLPILLSLPLLSLAQTEPVSSHFYVGAGATLLTNAPFASAGVPRLLGPSLTTGLALSAHLAVQAGVTYHWKNDSYTTPVYHYGQTGGTIGGTTSTENRKYFTVPVLLRYTFTPSSKRLLVDGLAGLTVLHSTLHAHYDMPYSIVGERNDAATRASLTLGPALRYALTPNVAVTGNAVVGALLGDTYTTFSDRLYLNALVGIYYTFGQR